MREILKNVRFRTIPHRRFPYCSLVLRVHTAAAAPRPRAAARPDASAAAPTPPGEMRLLDRVRWHLRIKRYSIRTEKAYLDWVRRFILFHQKRHPAQMGEEEIAAFLSHLAIEGRVAASTQSSQREAVRDGRSSRRG